MIRKFEKNDIDDVMEIWKNENIKAGFLERQRQIRSQAYRIEQEHSHELTSEKEIQSIIGRIDNALSGAR